MLLLRVSGLDVRMDALEKRKNRWERRKNPPHNSSPAANMV